MSDIVIQNRTNTIKLDHDTISHGKKNEIKIQSLLLVKQIQKNQPNIDTVQQLAGKLQLKMLQNDGTIDNATFIGYAQELKGIGLGAEDAAKLLGNIILMASHARISRSRILLSKIQMFTKYEFIKTYFLQTKTITQFIKVMQEEPAEGEDSAPNDLDADYSENLPSLVQALINIYVAQAYTTSQDKQLKLLNQAWAQIQDLINQGEAKNNIEDILYVMHIYKNIKQNIRAESNLINKLINENQEYTDAFIEDNFGIKGFSDAMIVPGDPINRASELSQPTDFGKKLYSYFNNKEQKVRFRSKFKTVKSMLKPKEFEAMFELLSGISYVEFSAMIRGDINFSINKTDTGTEQSIIPVNEKYEPTNPLRNNEDYKSHQEFFHDANATFQCDIDIQGTKTLSSNAQKDKEIFTAANEAGYFGINHNIITTDIKLTDSTNTTFNTYTLAPQALQADGSKTPYIFNEQIKAKKSMTYKLDTVGSYQINQVVENKDKTSTDLAVENAKQLLKPILKASGKEDEVIGSVEETERFIVDFKPLKRLAGAGPDILTHDNHVFDTHTEIMAEAVDSINKENPDIQYNYIPLWGNSHKIATPGCGAPESNTNFQAIITFFEKNISKNDKSSLELLATLKRIVNSSDMDPSHFDDLDFLHSDPDEMAGSGSGAALDKDSFKSRGKFRMIVAITRILGAKFPGKFVFLMGCMSAKDRAMSLLYATNLITMLYHLKGNLDFISDTGRLKPEYFKTPADIYFLRDHLNNTLGQTILSYMGIGRLNNKNLDLLAHMFKDIPELYSLFDQTPLVVTAA